MLLSSHEYGVAAKADNRKPVLSLFVSWRRQSASGAYFTIGVSLIGGGDVIRGEGNNPAESDTFVYDEETLPVLSLETERQFSEPVYSVARGLADVVLENTSGRYTPGVDPDIGDSLKPQRPIRIALGFDYGGAPELVQHFVGQISHYPEYEKENATVHIKAVDYADVIYNYPLESTQLYTNKRTDELVVILLQEFGLTDTKYQVDPGTITVPYAFFPVGTKMGEILRKLAEIEGGAFYVDENGIFRFETRLKWADAPRTNRRHLRIDVTAYTNGDRRWQTPLATVSSPATYYFRNRYRSNVPTKLVAEFVDGSSASTYEEIAAGLAASPTDWTENNYAIDVPSGTVHMRAYQVIEQVGWLEVDDFWLTVAEKSVIGSFIPNFSTEVGTPGTNFVTNGAFETSSTGFSAIGTSTISRVTTQAYIGSYALQVVVSTAGQGVEFSPSGLTVGQPYVYVLWAKGAVGGEQLTFMVSPLNFASKTITLTTEWQQVIVPGTATSTGGNALITLTGTGTFYIDDVQGYYGTAGTPDDWTYAGFGTNTAYGSWINRGYSDIALEITDGILLNEEQQNPNGRDTIVNLVEVFAKPRKVVSVAEKIFEITTNDSRVLQPGETIEFFTNYADPVQSVTTPTAGGVTSVYLGNTQSNGGGTDKTSQLQIIDFTTFSQASKVQIKNNDSGVVYLTSFVVYGFPAKVTQEIYVKRYDQDSIDDYGERPVKIENDFIQTSAAAVRVADTLITDRKDPANYRLLTIRAHPGLQLGDRVRWKNQDYFVIRIKTKFTASDGLVQELTIVKRQSYS